MKRVLGVILALMLVLGMATMSVAAVKGDLNSDGAVSAADAAAILRYCVRLQELDQQQRLLADVDLSGDVTASDASMILRFVVHLVDEFPSEPPAPTTGSLDIYMIDVGFGDSILLVSPNGKTMLIDSGNNGQNDHNVSAKIQMNNLFDEFEIDSFNLGVYTHAHSDHVNGFINYMFSDYGFDAFAASGLNVNTSSSTYQNITAALNAQSFPTSYVTTTSNTAVFTSWDEDVDIDVLWPIANYRTSDWNDTSLVLKVSCGGYSIILTGDATAHVESELIRRYDADTLDCDVLKVGHRTSNGSTSEAFLASLTPDYAIASFSQYSYNWPGSYTVSRLAAAGLTWNTSSNSSGRLFGTAYHGNIHVSFDADGISISTEYDLTDSSWNAPYCEGK